MHKINLTQTEKQEKRMKRFFPFFENFNRDFETLCIEINKLDFEFLLAILELGYMQI